MLDLSLLVRSAPDLHRARKPSHEVFISKMAQHFLYMTHLPLKYGHDRVKFAIVSLPAIMKHEMSIMLGHHLKFFF